MNKEYKSLDFQIVKRAVADNCSFSLSEEMVMESMPCFDELYANRDLERGKQALKAYISFGAPGFAGVTDIQPLLEAIGKDSLAAPGDLIRISNVLRANQSLEKYLKVVEFDIPAIADLVNTLGYYPQLIDMVEKAIDPNGSIKDSASPRLGGLRRSISATENEISKQTSVIMSQYHDILMDNITAVRNNRTCLLVKASDKNKLKGFVHDESASRQAVYIEPEVLLQLNNRLQSLRSNAKEEEERIIRSICESIKPYVDEIAANVRTLAVLDSLFAKAGWASKNEAIYGNITADEHLYFKNARHPLIDPEKVVSNTYELKLPYHHLLISGSNTGGKTVTLKTIGLFVILTMSGFPITCEEAFVPLFDNVYVDLGDEQSIIESLSTFSSHLEKISKILDKATKKSLVLLDELGSGTDPKEGECLAIAILDYLQHYHIMSVATTHYSRVKEYAKSQDDILLASVGFDLKTMMPTYKYLSGFSGNSNALEIAERYGIKDEVIKKAYELRASEATDISTLMDKIDADKAEIEEEKENLIKQREELEAEQEKLQNAERKLKNDEKAILSTANIKVEAISAKAKTEAEKIIAELKAKESIKPHEAIETLSKLDFDREEEPEKEKDHTFKKGDYVSIDGLKYHGEIISIKGKNTIVLCNGMKMNVKVNRLSPMKRPKMKNSIKVSGEHRVHSMSTECNVIGMHVDEALAEIEKYLDTAMYNRIYVVRLVHGSGTGALRKAIHEYLKKNPEVKEYRLGGQGEGGLGATVVTLKGKNNG